MPSVLLAAAAFMMAVLPAGCTAWLTDVADHGDVRVCILADPCPNVDPPTRLDILGWDGLECLRHGGRPFAHLICTGVDY